MKITITGKHIDLGESMPAYAEEALGKAVEKYFTSAVSASIMFSKERESIKAEITVHPTSGLLLKGEAKAGDAYAALDQAVARISRQLNRYKDRLVEHRNEKIELVPMSVIESDEEKEVAATAPVIIAETQTELPICSVSGAVMRMDLTDAPALLFRNSAHGELNMVYRRADGNIGWVDPKHGK